MERRDLTKADLDKVRDIEGFPIGTDEDIIALSDAPYYTACPNPFIADFIAEYGHPYDPETDDYHREPFAADVSEGKGDALYMAHSYHTKVPYRAIMKYILHYTNPGDIIFDGFCGTGMTGVAAFMCGSTDKTLVEEEKRFQKNIEWGNRYAIVGDLSPYASFIASLYNRDVDPYELEQEVKELLRESMEELGWVYETISEKDNKQSSYIDDIKGTINYTVWSEVLICPQCGYEVPYYTLVTMPGKGSKSKTLSCPKCHADISKNSFVRAIEKDYDSIQGQAVDKIKRTPVEIIYSYNGKNYKKTPGSFDFEILQRLNEYKPKWFPIDKMMFIGDKWGDSYRAGYHTGIDSVHHFFTKRNLYVLSSLYSNSEHYKNKNILQGIILSCLSRASLRNRYIPEYGNRHVGTLSGTLYIPSLNEENNIFNAFELRSQKIIKAYSMVHNKCMVNNITYCGSVAHSQLPDKSIDYIFTDPPFGDNLIYSELNFISESWIKIFTNRKEETIISNSQNKSLNEYQKLMESAFIEYARVLKPNRWITIEFHNSQNAVWNSIQSALQKAGFIIADVRTLDKKKGTTKQLTYVSTVQQDLVISAYKPKESLWQEISEAVGTEETAWKFVRQHLEMLPVAPIKDEKIEIISERQNRLLYDRMVAYHVQNGLPVPIDAADFYKGLEERFIQRDGMYFLSGQVNEYDLIRIKHDMEDAVQLGFIVSNEKTAVQWLYMQLAEPQTYQVLQPKFMQEVKAVDKYEKIPELAELLEENFLKNDKGEWYIPDITKAGDVAKLREKRLLKEFEDYQKTKGKLKVFRIEAIRAGFKKLWDEKNYAAIVAIADRLPESVIQEDPNLLMYSDLASTRV